MAKKYLSYFSKSEIKTIRKFVRLRVRLLAPLLKLLAFLRIKPDYVSYFGLFVLIGFVYFIKHNPSYAFLFLLAHVLIDGLDGPLARFTKQASNSGALTDIICDHIGMAIVIISLIHFQYINAVNGAIYIFLYILLITLTIGRNTLDRPPLIVIRTKYLVYILYGVLAFFNLDYINYSVIIFNILMLPQVITGYFVLKKTLRNQKVI